MTAAEFGNYTCLAASSMGVTTRVITVLEGGKSINPCKRWHMMWNQDVILAGDYNINVLSIKHRLVFTDLFYEMLSHICFPK